MSLAMFSNPKSIKGCRMVPSSNNKSTAAPVIAKTTVSPVITVETESSFDSKSPSNGEKHQPTSSQPSPTNPANQTKKVISPNIVQEEQPGLISRIIPDKVNMQSEKPRPTQNKEDNVSHGKKKQVVTLQKKSDSQTNSVFDLLEAGSMKIENYDGEFYNTFEEMELSPQLLHAVRQKFVKPSPVQVASIPAVMQGRNIYVQAQTGTGKTAAFCIPCIQNIDPTVKKCSVLIITHVREIAIQIFSVVSHLCEGSNITCALHIGGRTHERDERGVTYVHNVKPSGSHNMYSYPFYCEQIVVGTPGKLASLIEIKSDGTNPPPLNVSELKTVVIDEVDSILGNGYYEQLKTIVQPINNSCQYALYSATVSKPVIEFVSKFMADPVIITVENQKVVMATQKQFLLCAKNDAIKVDVLSRVFAAKKTKGKIIIFTNTIEQAKTLNNIIKNDLGLKEKCEFMSSELTQAQRDKVMEDLRSSTSTLEVVVATDIIGRGIDTDIELVINFDIPCNISSYAHRIGRTGRYGKNGMTLNLSNETKEFDLVKTIVRVYGIEMGNFQEFMENYGIAKDVTTVKIV